MGLVRRINDNKKQIQRNVKAVGTLEQIVRLRVLCSHWMLVRMTHNRLSPYNLIKCVPSVFKLYEIIN